MMDTGSPFDHIWNKSDLEELNDTLLLDFSHLRPPLPLDTALRIVTVFLYSVICGVGIVGNLLVMHLTRRARGPNQPVIHVFVFNLALTDLHFVLVLPLWAAEVALDLRWPFGHSVCRLALFLTALNMYASVFFLAAMGVSRYCTVVQTLRPGRTPPRRRTVKWVSLGIWLAAALASLPPTIYSGTIHVHGEDLCIQKFSDKGYSLAHYQIQKITVAFMCPLLIISVCYLLILKFLQRHHLRRYKRNSKLTKAITMLVLVFFFCWLPNHIMTFWSVLVKLEVVPWNTAFYNAQTYFHPLAIFLANANSCLNPVIYCLTRRQFRESLKALFYRICHWLSRAAQCLSDPSEGSQVAVPLNQVPAKEASQAPERNGDTLPGTRTSCVERG
ncbi:relaxin-3 receptor 1-like [Narcine bancroftii]|uniref:relaxin-3 receptor 1-like n=1 Tax=Narcine bancroftii TaxID=1343680 RepID=UPI003831E0E8